MKYSCSQIIEINFCFEKGGIFLNFVSRKIARALSLKLSNVNFNESKLATERTWLFSRFRDFQFITYTHLLLDLDIHEWEGRLWILIKTWLELEVSCWFLIAVDMSGTWKSGDIQTKTLKIDKSISSTEGFIFIIPW